MVAIDLSQSIVSLTEAIGRHRSVDRHVLSDFVLACLATDVCDSAMATQLLGATAVAHAAMPNARRAYESAIEMEILVVDRARYDEFCAHLRVFELFETEALAERGRGVKGIAPASSVRIVVEHTVIQEAAEWDRRASGQGMHLRRAWESFTKLNGARPLHWSGKSQVQFLCEITGADVNTETYLWGAMSMETHARTRIGGRVIRNEDGAMTLHARPEDAEQAARVADLACEIAVEALAARREW